MISQVNNSSKRAFNKNRTSAKIINEDRKKEVRINSRKQAKIEVINEEGIVMSTPREILKEEYGDAHLLQNLPTSCRIFLVFSLFIF